MEFISPPKVGGVRGGLKLNYMLTKRKEGVFTPPLRLGEVARSDGGV